MDYSLNKRKMAIGAKKGSMMYVASPVCQKQHRGRRTARLVPPHIHLESRGEGRGLQAFYTHHEDAGSVYAKSRFQNTARSGVLQSACTAENEGQEEA